MADPAGLDVPTPRLPLDELIEAVLPSSSNIPLMIRFHELTARPDHVPTSSEEVSHQESVA